MTEREQIINKLKKLEWFLKSDENIRQELIDFPESFSSFMDELTERPESVGGYKVVKLLSISFGNHFVMPIFEVTNLETGETSEYEYIGRKRGKSHSVRGLIMVESQGELQYFIARKTNRFAIGSETYESIGSIYPPPEDTSKDNFAYKSFLEGEVSKQLGLDRVTFDRFYDLGGIYPDVGMTHHMVNLFAAVISTDNPDSIMQKVGGKSLNQKNYFFGYEKIPANELLTFLAKTNDAHILAIFGRLQAMKVVKI
jgi:hypothetical protein